jgi:hypothetical protein
MNAPWATPGSFLSLAAFTAKCIAAGLDHAAVCHPIMGLNRFQQDESRASRFHSHAAFSDSALIYFFP